MKKIKAIIMAVLVTATMMTAVGCSNNTSSGEGGYTNDYSFVTPTNYKDLAVAANKIYAASDSDTGSLDIYYNAGAWVTLNNDELYSIQQYLVPNKESTLHDVVKDVPSFNEDTVTYMGFDATTGNVLTFDGDKTWKDICNEYDTTALGVYLEWEGKDGFFYSYVLQYADVSILYTYTEELNQFRAYVANSEAQGTSSETQPIEGTELPDSVNTEPLVPESETSISEETGTADTAAPEASEESD